jgi:predicted GNAT family acetyltransferase
METIKFLSGLKTEKMNDITVKNNTAQQQFEVSENNELAVLVYRFYKNDIALMHTQVPPALENKGIASALAKAAFEWAKEHNKKVMVYCPFAASYLKRHPEYNFLVDESHV